MAVSRRECIANIKNVRGRTMTTYFHDDKKTVYKTIKTYITTTPDGINKIYHFIDLLRYMHINQGYIAEYPEFAKLAREKAFEIYRSGSCPNNMKDFVYSCTRAFYPTRQQRQTDNMDYL
jgi:hypothetical protein